MTTVWVTVEIPMAFTRSELMTQSLNAFFLDSCDGYGMALSVCRPPVEADGPGRGATCNIAADRFFRLFAKVPWRMTKKPPTAAGRVRY